MPTRQPTAKAKSARYPPQYPNELPTRSLDPLCEGSALASRSASVRTHVSKITSASCAGVPNDTTPKNSLSDASTGEAVSSCCGAKGRSSLIRSVSLTVVIPSEVPVLLGSAAVVEEVEDEEGAEEEEDEGREEGSAKTPRCVIPLKSSGTVPPETSPSNELKKVRSS